MDNQTFNVLVPLVACGSLGVLILLVARQSRRRRVNQLFVWALSLFAGASLGSFMAYSVVMSPHFWDTFSLVLLMFASVAFFHFVRVFLRRSEPRLWLSLGYGACILYAIAAALGYAIKDSELGLATYAMSPIALSFVGASIFNLVQGYRWARDPFARNRIAYPLAALILFVLFQAISFVPALLRYQLDQIGGLLAAILLSYAILRYRLLDISIALRRAYLYSLLTIFILAVFISIATLLQSAFRVHVGYSFGISVVLTALILAVAFRPVYEFAQRWVDRRFYREAYDYRQGLMTASQRMSVVLDLGELAEWLVESLKVTMQASKVGLLLLDPATHRYVPRMLRGYDDPSVERITLGSDSPVLARLKGVDSCLTAEEIGRLTQLGSPERSEQLTHLGAAVLVPLKVKDNLIGMLVLGPKRSEQAYSLDDLAFLRTVANQAAVAVENARLYEASLHSERLRALGEMAGGVAHDFNNILAIILGRAQLALEDVKDAKLRKDLQIIEQTALDAARTVRRLQDFARVRVDRVFEVVSLNELVEGALQMVESRRVELKQTVGATIEISTELSEVAPVEGDAAELREALVNIIFNAMDAMPEGGKITIKSEQENKWVLLSVSDTGVGIPWEIQGRIFDPFFTTRAPKGVGLGLSVTYGIVTRHGGSIDVESSRGRGATFYIRLPAASGVEERARPERKPPIIKRATILVVDDDPEVSEVLGLMLQQLGHRVTGVTSGKEALGALKKGDYELVITDLGMTEMSGHEVARAVKEIKPETPVMLITGWWVQLDPEELPGIDGVIAKPFSKDALSAQIAELLPTRKREKRG